MVLVWAIFSIHLSICMNGLIVPSLKYNKFMYYFLVVLIWRHTIGYAFMYEPVCVDVALTHRFFSISFFQRNIYKKNTQLWLLTYSDRVIVNCRNASKFVRLTELISLAIVNEAIFFFNVCVIHTLCLCDIHSRFRFNSFFWCLCISSFFLCVSVCLCVSALEHIPFNQRYKMWKFIDMYTYMLYEYGNSIKYS